MKNSLKRRSVLKALFLTTLVAGTALLGGFNSQAINFAGNGNTGFGGPVGNGSLSVTDNGTNLTFTLNLNGGNMGGNGVALYIDTGAGGFTNTAGFLDNGDGGREVLSGYNNSSEISVMTFTNGFTPAYAISFSDGGYNSLFGLVNGGANSFNYITGTGATPYSLTISAANLGLTPGVKATIRIFGSLISTTGYRSTEAIAGNDITAFGQGWNPFTQTAYGTYTFDSPPIPSQPVTFQVDMTEQIANGKLNPANGDTVYASGSFVTNANGLFQLTPALGNTNIYTGVYPDSDPAGTPEIFKYKFISGVTTNSEGTGVGGRPFTLLSGGQTLPVVYYDDLFPFPSATTNELSFSINMAPQIYLGHFNPANGDQIEVLGTLTSPYWTQAEFILTNNPNGANSNIYSGTVADGNYPGSYENYKFVIIAGGTGTATYENFNSGANRAFFTPTNSATFPLAYFNGVSNVYSTPITFQVNMTAPLAAGTFNPGAGDTVSVSGTFQTNQYTPDVFILTNNPSGANSNIYSGTYIDQDAPGTGEQYKFVITSGGTSTYETIAANRTFLLGSTAQTLPVVYYNNEDPADVLLAATVVTFTVNMTNAVDEYGYPFDPANDDVLINGDFVTPNWPVNWTDPLISSDYSSYVLQNNPVGSLLYTGTFTVPAGNSLQVDYKYGIYHNTGSFNTNADNEAGFALNHTRFIRATGTYNFPVDLFGIQRVNPAAAVEPLIGNLAIGPRTGGSLPITWLGLPAAYLQYATNLVAGPWVEINATVGAEATTWNPTNGAAFFRIVNP